MAINLATRYPGRANPADTNYPQGSFKNRSAPGVLDGSYLEKDWANDFFAFFQQLLVEAGISPNDTVDNATNSQYYQALKSVFAEKNDFLSIATTAFEASVTDGEAVYWDSVNSRFDEAIADGTNKQNMIGFADVTNGRVILMGAYSGQLSGLTPGAKYYLSGTAAGVITATVPTNNGVSVGVAKSATELFVDIDQSNQKQQSAIQGSFRNLKGSATGTNAVVTYTIDEIITGDGAGEYLTTRNWNSTITMTLAGAGGLDTGAVAASTWYFAFAITKDDGTKELLASLSSTLPTLPVGYTKWARIGAFKTDGTANKYPLGFKQFGRRVQYVVSAGTNVTGMPQMAAGTNVGSPSTPTWVAVATANFLPSTALSIAGVIHMSPTSGYGFVAPNNQFGVLSSTTNPPPGGTASYGGAHGVGQFNFVLESANIYWNSANTAGELYCLGWEDNV